jgi:hypothetical protein
MRRPFFFGFAANEKARAPRASGLHSMVVCVFEVLYSAPPASQSAPRL